MALVGLRPWWIGHLPSLIFAKKVAVFYTIMRRIKQLLGLWICMLAGLYGCAGQAISSGIERPIAFPGAEGFGKYTTGGRGGEVMIVSTLSDAGAGSFREAAESKKKRIIVFAVSGTIHLEKPVSIKGDVTIAGQSAPGDGICLADQPVSLGGNNIIVRYLRFRLGDKFQSQKGKVNGSGSDDAFGGSRRKGIIIDHCSISWSTDELMSVYGGDSTSLQWNLLSEPLNYSYHFETGDKDFEQHGYGGIWGGAHLSAHHNLFAHCVSRNPRFNGARLGAEMELVDFRNNVIYNWGGNNVYGGEGGKYNMVANYFKAGPGTAKKVAARIVNPTRNELVGFGKFYVAENEVFASKDISNNNKAGIHIGSGKEDFSADSIIMSRAFEASAIPHQSASDAFAAVLLHAGASFKRDTLDMRIVADVTYGKGRFIDVQGGYPHGTPYEMTVAAWPNLRSAEAPADTDKDGMPDAWELKNGLKPQDGSDAMKYTLHKHFANIEMYLNGLLEK
jgi:pectate lyase